MSHLYKKDMLRVRKVAHQCYVLIAALPTWQERFAAASVVSDDVYGDIGAELIAAHRVKRSRKPRLKVKP